VSPAVDMSGVERLAHDWESGAATTGEFCKRFPSEVAKVRRQVYRQAGDADNPFRAAMV
jgi:hypothetical protein